MKLTFVTGDATEPTRSGGYDLILHCVNDEGVMGGGIALSIRKKFPKAYDQYRSLFEEPSSKRKTAQGQLQVVEVGKNLFVANLFGQSSMGDICGFPAVRYGAIEEGLIRLRERMKQCPVRITIHTGRIGCSLAGGSWKKIEDIFKDVFESTEVDIIVYDYPGSTFNP